MYDDLNVLHYGITKGLPSERDLLLSYSIDEYFAEINTFMLAKEQERQAREQYKKQTLNDG